MVFVTFSIGSAHLQPQEVIQVRDAVDVTMQQEKYICFMLCVNQGNVFTCRNPIAKILALDFNHHPEVNENWGFTLCVQIVRVSGFAKLL